MMERGYDSHVQRIAEIKSSVDSRAPRSKPPSKKKEIDRRRRCQAIEQDNRLLLERLAKIMRKKTIDNENKHAKFGKSLTQTHRRLELQRITQENQRLLKRIQETEPIYNHLNWEEDAKKRSMYMKNMSDFQEYVPPARTVTSLFRNRSASTRRIAPESTPAKERPVSAPRRRMSNNQQHCN